MNVLVAVASRHGSTRGIAEAIVDELRGTGVDAELRDAGAVPDVTGYDAVVIGSAVYAGAWVPAARDFVEEHRDRLASMPVWLFSSGPLGADEPKPAGEPEYPARLVASLPAREHRIFAGRLQRSELGLGERLIAKMVKAPEGDFRDWEAIRGWARTIAATLAPSPERRTA